MTEEARNERDEAALWPRRTPILGVAVSALDLPQATDLVIDCVAQKRRIGVTVTGVHGVIEALDDPEFRTILNRSDLCVPDGVPLVWLSRRRGFPDVGRVFGPDLMLAVSARMAHAGGKAFYYGGGPGVAEALAAEMTSQFPGLLTAGTYCPPFRPLAADEAREIADIINASGADVLWIGLSTPKQERWMAEMRPLLEVPVMAAVGAAFDYNTGRLDRAPEWMQKSALEWLYRMKQEPRRLAGRYLRNNPRFLWNLMAEACGLKKFD